MNYIPVLKEHFYKTVIPHMMSRFGYKNPMAVPKLLKITINMGIGEGHSDKDMLMCGMNELSQITGQRPCIRYARKAISGFKIRRGMEVGCMVTLRGNRMYEFLHRLIVMALPRVRDFRGLSRRSFDGRGNYTLGIREQIIFPEVDYDKVKKIRGMNVTFTTSAKKDEEAYELLKTLGLPFRD